MKLLLIVQQHKRTIFDRMHASIARHAGECDIHRLDDEAQWHLQEYFARHIDTKKYDRILLVIRLKRSMKQRRFLSTLPNLCFLEIDACQNFYPKSKYYGQYSRHYRQLPWARVICTGYQVAEKLRVQGLDVAFAPKGYDQQLMENLHRPRLIELGFIGSLKSDTYADRRNFLLQLEKLEPLQILRTKPGRDYVEKMNEIRFFISADINFDEYMIKNFEAMAAGCVLCAFDQGEAENSAIGFQNMENIVLYKSIDDLREKLTQLRANPSLAQQIADRGQAFAEANCTFEIWGQRIVNALAPPLRQRNDYPANPVTWLSRIKSWLGL